MEERMKETVEINGVKFEVDLSTARKIEDFKVGDKVKVLRKDYSEYKIYPGVIIGFQWFETLPTIVIAYLKMSYGSADIEFLYYNAETKETEISHTDNLELIVSEEDVIRKLDAEILLKAKEVEGLEAKKEYFKTKFKQYFNEFSNLNKEKA